MTKYSGKIGFIIPMETDPGVWHEIPEERSYKGDVLRNMRNWRTNSESINDNIIINNSISIVADSYFIDHAPFIRYAEFMGSFWKVTNIDATNPPRMILELGGVYNRVSKSEESKNSTSE